MKDLFPPRMRHEIVKMSAGEIGQKAHLDPALWGTRRALPSYRHGALRGLALLVLDTLASLPYCSPMK